MKREFFCIVHLSYITNKQVYLLNKANHDYIRKIIDCESEQYLQNFIEKIHVE
jgi:hypothetical protein